MPGNGTITDLLDEAYYERQQITRLLTTPLNSVPGDRNDGAESVTKVAWCNRRSIWATCLEPEHCNTGLALATDGHSGKEAGSRH
jgi:hypothetical protein